MVEKENLPQFINDRYRVLDLLGKGGMGQVLLVEDTHRGNLRMALKTLLAHTTDELLTSGFRDEFAELAKLEHPHLARAFDFGRIAETGEYFFTTEFVRGEELSRIARDASTQALLEITVQILRALDFIHGHGILHNDLKPANLLVAKDSDQRSPERDFGRLDAVIYGHVGTVKLIDFGLISREHTAWNKILGTLRYISPERIRRETADRRSDLYSLGVVLYVLFARRPPFDARDTRVLLKQHLEAPPPPLASLRPDLPQALVALVHRLLEKRPDDRFASAGEALRTLTEALGQDAVGTVPAASRSRASRLSPGSLLFRDAELARISTAFEAIEGHAPKPQALIVTGAHGSGKTRLVEELRARVQVAGGLFVRIECQAGDKTLRPMVDELLRALSTSGHPERQEIAARLDVRKAERNALADSLEKEILALSAALPVFLTFDGYERASPALRQLSLDLLHAIENGGDTSKAPLRLLIVIARGSEAKRTSFGLSNVPEIELASFNNAQSAAFLQEVFEQTDIPNAVLDRLARASEGNPLFLIELARALVEKGAATLSGSGWMFSDSIDEIALPRSLDHLVTSRIEALTAQQRETIEWIAAAGRPISIRVLEQCVSMRARKLHAEIDLLVSRNLIEKIDVERPGESGEERGDGNDTSAPADPANEASQGEADGHETFVRLLHPDTREAVLGKLDKERRRFLHQRLAQNIQAVYPTREDLDDVLADHWLLAGNETGFIRFASRAADMLRKRGDYATAVRYHEQIAKSVPEMQLQKRLQSIARLADMHEFLWDLDSCLAHLEEIHRLGTGLMKPVDRALILRRIAAVELSRHRPREALERIEEAQKLLTDAPAPLYLALEAVRTLAWVLDGRADEARGAIPQIRSALVSSATSSGSADLRALLLRVGCANQLASACSLLGQLELASTLLEENLQSLETTDQLQAIGATHCALGSVLLDRGVWDRAEHHLSEAHRIGKEVGDRRTVCRARERMGELHLRFGKLREALRAAEVGLEEALSIGNRAAILNASRTIARIHLATDDAPAAKRTLRRAMESNDPVDPLGHALARLTLAECHLEAGDAAAARSELEILRRDRVASTFPLVMAGCFRLAMLATWRAEGRLDVTSFHKAESLIIAHDLRGELVDWLLTRASVEAEGGDSAAANETLRRLSETTSGLDQPPIRLEAALVRAQIHFVAGDIDTGRSLLRRLHDLARHRGKYRLARLAGNMADMRTVAAR